MRRSAVGAGGPSDMRVLGATTANDGHFGPAMRELPAASRGPDRGLSSPAVGAGLDARRAPGDGPATSVADRRLHRRGALMVAEDRVVHGPGLRTGGRARVLSSE